MVSDCPLELLSCFPESSSVQLLCGFKPVSVHSQALLRNSRSGGRLPEMKTTSDRPSFSDLAGQLVEHNEPFLRDTLAVARVPVEQVATLAASLREQGDFWSIPRVRECVEKTITDTSLQRSTLNVLWGLGQMVRDYINPVDENVGALYAALKGREGVTSDDVERLKTNLDHLLVKQPALDYLVKAGHLSIVTGKELKGLEFISDIRAVFDEERTKIIGVLPYTTLRIEVDDLGRKTSVELRITEEQLNAISEKAELAKVKVSTIRAFAQELNIPVPTVGGEV